MNLKTRVRPVEVASPVREALRAAIEAHTEESRQYRALQDARAKADDRVQDARARIDAAQAAIESAREAAVRDLIDGTNTAPSASMARAEADDAADALVNATAAREAIASRLETAERRQGWHLTVDKVTNCALDVLRTEGGDAFADLVADLERMQRDLLSRTIAVRWLIDKGLVGVKMIEVSPNTWITPPAAAINARAAVPPIHWQADGIEGAAAWVDALELLMKDADAPLPG